MLCQACSDLLNWKSAPWKGLDEPMFESGDGCGQLTSTDSTTLNPEADSSDVADSDSDSSERPCYFDPSKPGGFIHHPSGRAFLAAVQQGCQLCLLLASQLSSEQKLEMAGEPEHADATSADYDHVVASAFLEGFRVPGEWVLSGCYSPRTLRLQRDPIWLKNVQFFPSKIQQPLPAPDISYPNAVGWGEASVSLVRRWIAACEEGEEHVNCRIRLLTDVYKTRGRPRFARIVDVQDGSSDPRLADVDEVPAGAIYMTLSHCWGDPKHKPLTLTLNTLAPFKKGILWNTLPKTFADAIVFTRNMGIRYIWIDSLCIIQDCADDWASQSAVMCEIYTGSYLNLAATAAADCRAGLFVERDGRLIQPLRVAQPPRPGRSSSGAGVIQYYDAVDDEEWKREVEEEPLCHRAWIIQERALVRRSLHFGRRQLYWECTSMQASENVPLGYPVGWGDFKVYDPLLPSRASTGDALVETWEMLLMDYTRAGLTKETDKLVAISGLAKALAAQSGIQYLAGLWNYDLERQLHWHVESSSKRPDVFRAPSWSWASTNSIISYGDYIDTPAIKVLRVQLNSASPIESFATFKSSPITIRGVLVPGMVVVVGEKDDVRLNVLISRTKPIGATGDRKSPWSVGFSPDADMEQDNRGAVLLLPTQVIDGMIMYPPVPMDVSLCMVYVTGMVLKATGVKGTLRRVGTFGLNESMPKQHPLRKVWLMDSNGITSSTTPSNDEVGDGDGAVPRNTLHSASSKTDPLEGISEDLYHSYEEIGDSGGQAQSCFDKDYDWTPVFSGGFTFDLV